MLTNHFDNHVRARRVSTDLEVFIDHEDLNLLTSLHDPSKVYSYTSYTAIHFTVFRPKGGGTLSVSDYVLFKFPGEPFSYYRTQCATLESGAMTARSQEERILALLARLPEQGDMVERADWIREIGHRENLFVRHRSDGSVHWTPEFQKLAVELGRWRLLDQGFL